MRRQYVAALFLLFGAVVGIASGVTSAVLATKEERLLVASILKSLDVGVEAKPVMQEAASRILKAPRPR